jgi:hypothetical protein
VEILIFSKAYSHSRGAYLPFEERPTRGEGSGASGPRKRGVDLLTENRARQTEPAESEPGELPAIHHGMLKEYADTERSYTERCRIT